MFVRIVWMISPRKKWVLYKLINRINELCLFYVLIIQELDENVTRIATECLRIRRIQLFKAIAFRAASSRHGYLDNYDWSLVQVVCNDQMASMQSLLVKLTLVIVEADQQRRTLSIEMNKLELSSFIQILQLAEKDLQEQLLCKDVANLIVA